MHAQIVNVQIMVANETPPPPFHHTALLYSMATLVPYQERNTNNSIVHVAPHAPIHEWPHILGLNNHNHMRIALSQLTNVITPHKTPRIRHPKHPHPVMCMFPAPTSPPLPIRRMVLNTVQLNQSFVGYLAKLGKHFMGFMDSMHRIG